jgi:hypothetical protein
LTLDWAHGETVTKVIRNKPTRSPRRLGVEARRQKLESLAVPDGNSEKLDNNGQEMKPAISVKIQAITRGYLTRQQLQKSQPNKARGDNQEQQLEATPTRPPILEDEGKDCMIKNETRRRKDIVMQELPLFLGENDKAYSHWLCTHYGLELLQKDSERAGSATDLAMLENVMLASMVVEDAPERYGNEIPDGILLKDSPLSSLTPNERWELKQVLSIMKKFEQYRIQRQEGPPQGESPMTVPQYASIARDGDPEKVRKELERLAALREHDAKFRQDFPGWRYYFDSVHRLHIDIEEEARKVAPRSILRKIGLPQEKPNKVSFSDSDRWTFKDDNDPDFGTFTIPCKSRERKLTGPQWRHQQAQWQQKYGTVIKQTKWHIDQSMQKVTFATTDLVHQEGEHSRVVDHHDPERTAKQWRLVSFKPKHNRTLEKDELAIHDCQVAQWRLEQKEKRREEQQHYQQQFQQALQEGHPKLEKQRMQYKEALRRQAEEVRRQLDAKAKRKGMRKKKPWHPKTQTQIVETSPETPMVCDHMRNTLKVTITMARHSPSTAPLPSAPLHRKAVPQKIPQSSSRPTKRISHSAQGTPIHRKALRHQPFGTPTQQLALSPAQHTPIRRKALHQQSFGTSGRRGLPWHQAWISPTHRKTLRQQPF